MATITFNDGTARTLQNNAPYPGSNFRGWKAQPKVQAARQFSLADGTPYVWKHRTDWKVSFAIENLRPVDLDVAQYCIAHLENAGTVTLNTGDTSARTHTAMMSDGDGASIDGPNERGYYTFSATLTVIPAPATPPLCTYYT